MALSTALTKGLKQQQVGFQASLLSWTSSGTCILPARWAGSSGSTSWMLKAMKSRPAKLACGYQTDMVDCPASPELLIFIAGPCSFCELTKFCNLAKKPQKTNSHPLLFFFYFLIEKADRTFSEASSGRTAKATGRSAQLGAGNRRGKPGIYKWDWSSTTKVHLWWQTELK